MQRSTHRILTTHVGSLARPDALIPLLRLKERGQPYDTETFARLVREAVADVVRKQVEAGIDIVTDGEQGKPSFFGYVVERFDGFQRKPVRAGQEKNPRTTGREYRAFPDYYAWAEKIAEWAGGRGGDRTFGIDTCTGPIRYKGHALVQAEIDNLKAALRGLPHEDVFMPAIAPSYIAATLPNEHYRTETEYEHAIADALLDRRGCLRGQRRVAVRAADARRKKRRGKGDGEERSVLEKRPAALDRDLISGDDFAR